MLEEAVILGGHQGAHHVGRDARQRHRLLLRLAQRGQQHAVGRQHQARARHLLRLAKRLRAGRLFGQTRDVSEGERHAGAGGGNENGERDPQPAPPRKAAFGGVCCGTVRRLHGKA
jgi:hypothetical protein